MCSGCPLVDLSHWQTQRWHSRYAWQGREEQEPSPVHADESPLQPEGTDQRLLVRSGWVINGLGPGRPGPINQTKQEGSDSASGVSDGGGGYCNHTRRLDHHSAESLISEAKGRSNRSGGEAKSVCSHGFTNEGIPTCPNSHLSMDLISNPRSLLSPRSPSLHGDELCCWVCLCNTTQ